MLLYHELNYFLIFSALDHWKSNEFPLIFTFLFVCLDGIYKSCSLYCAVLWLTQKCLFLSLFHTKLYWNKRYLCQNNLSWYRNILSFVKLVPSLLVISQVCDSVARGVSVVSGHESKRCCNEELLSLKGPHVFRKILTWEMCLRRGFRACEPICVLVLNMPELLKKLCCHFDLEVYSMEGGSDLKSCKVIPSKAPGFFPLVSHRRWWQRVRNLRWEQELRQISAAKSES